MDSARLSAVDADSTPPPQIWSCVTCRRRKVKCDRRAPCCDVCTRSGIDCHYPVTGRRLPSKVRAPRWESPHQKQAEMLERLRRLESVVTELSAQVDEAGVDGGGARGKMVTPSETEGEMEEEEEEGGDGENFGELVTGGGGRVRINKAFWSVFCDEVDHIFQSLQDADDASQAEERSVAQPASTSTCYCHVFGLGADAAQPTFPEANIAPMQTSFLLQTFKDRVDPFIKSLTSDALKSICDSWMTPHSELEPQQAALRSSILFAATTSLTAAEIMAGFGKSKAVLLAKSRLLAEKDLARCQYLSTKNLPVMQALVIYTSTLPFANMQDIAGPIAASTVQIAMKSGIHDPMERNRHTDADIRLMTWLQVCFMASPHQVADSAASEWPVDAESVAECVKRLYPDAESQLLLSTRHAIWKLSRQLSSRGRTDIGNDAETVVAAAKMHIENEFEAHLHQVSKSPFIAFVQKMAELFFAKIQHGLLAQKWHGLKRGALFTGDAPITQSLLTTTMATLEATHSLNTKTDWAPWKWQLQGFFPWVAMKLVFAQFSDAQWTPLAERAWVLANAVSGTVPDDLRLDPAWASLVKLMDAAREHREREMARLMGDAMAEGDYLQIIEAGQALFYSSGSTQP